MASSPIVAKEFIADGVQEAVPVDVPPVDPRAHSVAVLGRGAPAKKVVSTI